MPPAGRERASESGASTATTHEHSRRGAPGSLLWRGVSETIFPRTADGTTRRLRILIGVSGAVYFCWWFLVELLLPGSFNPLAGRLLVCGTSAALIGASYLSHWVQRRLSFLFTGWTC